MCNATCIYRSVLVLLITVLPATRVVADGQSKSLLNSWFIGHDGDVKKETQEFADQVRQQLGLKKYVHVKKMRSRTARYHYMFPLTSAGLWQRLIIINEEFFESLTDQEKRFFIGSALVKLHVLVLHTFKRGIFEWINNKVSPVLGLLLSRQTFRRYEKEADLETAAAFGAQAGISFFKQYISEYNQLSFLTRLFDDHPPAQTRVFYLSRVSSDGKKGVGASLARFSRLLMTGNWVPEHVYNGLEYLLSYKYNFESDSFSASMQELIKSVQHDLGMDDWRITFIDDPQGFASADSINRIMFLNPAELAVYTVEEQKFIIGHELMHIKNHHSVKSFVEAITIAAVLWATFKVGMFFYNEYLEYQLDLLTAQKLDCAQGAFDYFDRAQQEQQQLSRFMRSIQRIYMHFMPFGGRRINLKSRLIKNKKSTMQFG